MNDDWNEDAAEAAALWLARRDRGLTAAEQREFAGWVAADPRHRLEMNRLDRAWAAADQARRVPEIVALAGSPPRRRRKPLLDWIPAGWLAPAAGLLAAALLFAVLRPARVAPAADTRATTGTDIAGSYRIVPAAARHVRLSDGTDVDLRGSAEIAERFTPSVRHVTLTRGEAHFAVAHNAARPFVVAAGALTVRAVGTAFDVRCAAGVLNVIVTRGRVAVETAASTPGAPAVPLLTAGERASIVLGPSGEPLRVAVDAPGTATLDRELGWRSTWLVFDRTPLATAVEAFARAGAGRLVIGEPAVGGRRLGGTFRADNVDGFVRLLQESLDVRSERRSDGVIVLRAER